MNSELLRALARATMERDRCDFDLDGQIAKARAAVRDLRPEVAAIVTEILKLSGPEIYECGHYAGMAAGLEIAREIYRR